MCEHFPSVTCRGSCSSMACPSIYPFIYPFSSPTFVLSESQESRCPPPAVWEVGNTLGGVETSSFTQSIKKGPIIETGGWILTATLELFAGWKTKHKKLFALNPRILLLLLLYLWAQASSFCSLSLPNRRVLPQPGGFVQRKWLVTPL